MPDLGNRANVMGPQPLGPIKQPEPAMLEASDSFLSSLIAGNQAKAADLAEDSVRDKVSRIANEVVPGAYNDYEILGRARIVQHYFVKARLHGSQVRPLTLQFRIGEDSGRWTIREVVNLTDVRSAWTK